jgi:hypothetical protein
MANEYLKYYIEAIWKGKNATVQASRDISGVGDGSEQSSKKLKGFNAALGAVAAAGSLAIIGKQAFEFGKASVNAFSDAEEAYGKFDVVFGEFARATETDLETIADATGRSKYELIDYASTIQDTFVPLGFAREEAAKMSTSITQLAIDLASFNNLETADVVRDLQSALVGNTETLRKYGVVAQETQIKQEAITLGLWDGTGAIDAQTKAQAILSLTYKGTTDAQGDAIRTADSYANKQRALEAATLDLKVAVGEGLVPALTDAASALIPYVNALATNISVANEWEQAVKDGIISQEMAAYWHNKSPDIYNRESEAYAYLTQATEDYNQALAETSKLTPREIQLQRSLAQIEEYETEKKIESSLALERYARGLQRAIGPADEFNEKTGMSAEQLGEIAAAAGAFEDSFVSALGSTEQAYGRWVTTATVVGGRTDEQQKNFEDLSREAENLRGNIASLQGGTASLGLTQDQINEKLATNYERLGLVESAMSPLASITTEYSDAQSKWVVDADALNDNLFRQVSGMSENAIVTASAALALGVYDEAQVATALNAAIIEEKINALAESFVNGEITAGQMKSRMDEIVQNSPYTSEIDVLVDNAISNIDKVKSKLDAIDGMVSKATVEVTTKNRTEGSAADSGGGGGRSASSIPEFATGGMVPGPIGQPQLIIAHGGEQVLTQDQQKNKGINLTINVTSGGGNAHMTGRKIANAVVEVLGGLT